MKQVEKMKLFTMIAVIALFIASCSENVDPDQAKVNLEMKAATALGTINPNGRTEAVEIEFTKAMVGVTKIEFEAEGDDINDDNSGSGSNDDGDDNSGSDDDDDDSDSDDDDQELEIKGNFEVDLLTGTSNPDFGISGITPGVYDELEIKMNPILDGGKTLIVEFNYSLNGADPVTIEISTSRELEFEVDIQSNVDLSATSISNILVLFDLDQLLSGIDFSSATADSNGVIKINETSNTGLYAAIASNLHYVLKAGEDDDHDDEFDDSDDD